MSTTAELVVAHPANISLKDFLEKVPVLEKRAVAVTCGAGAATWLPMTIPAIELYCGSEKCGGIRFFDPDDSSFHLSREGERAGALKFVLYHCRNCRSFGKEYALDIRIPDVRTRDDAVIYKIGENPAFGEPRPDIITDLLEDEIEFFDRGYRAETAGLGIGAFAYYRRFVESHKDKLIDKIREVAVAQGLDGGILAALDRARKTNSFEKAVEEVKDAIPPVLRLKGGHNPLTLLHSALSIGIHKDDDVVCLQRAQDIRTVLAALADKMTQALSASQELDSAVARLVNKKSKPAS